MPSVWPYCPESDIEERLAFRTATLETRLVDWRVSSQPAQQNLSYRHVLPNHTFLAAQELVRSNPAGEWYVPVWMEQTIADVSSADTTITANALHTYAVGGNAIVWTDAETYTVVEILSISGDVLTLTAAVGANHLGAIVMPVRTAFARGGFNTGRTSRYDSEIFVDFFCTDYPDLTPATEAAMDGIAYFSGEFAPVLSGVTVGSESGRIFRQSTITESGFGAVQISGLRDVTEEHASLTWGLETDAKRRAFYNFAHTMRGRDRRFYAPHIGGVLRVYGSTATTADILPIYTDLADYTGRVIRVAGEVRQVTGATLQGAYHRLAFASVSGSIQDVMFLKLFRADSDNWTFVHRANVRADINLPVVEALQ